MFYMMVVRVNSKSSHYIQNISFPFLFYLFGMMEVHKTYCGNPSMMYVKVNHYAVHLKLRPC